MRLTDSIYRIGTSNLINSYLVEDNGLVTIVDAALPGHWREFLDELRLMGRSLDDVRAVLLTHGDVDHIGFAERLRREQGVPVWVGAPDVAEARAEVKKPAAAPDRHRIVAMTSFLLYGATHGGLRSEPLTEVHPLSPGTALDVPGHPDAIELPGHTPGSMAFQFPAHDALFVGDAMTTQSVTTGRSGPALAPYTVDPVMARASLSALRSIEAGWLLPGHGPAWTGGVARALELIDAAAGRSAAAA